MRRSIQQLRRFLRLDDGVTAVEYTVMLALILLIVVAVVQTLGCNVQRTLQNAAQSIAS